MYQPINEQFAAATRQFAETAAQANRLALDNASAVFGLQLAAIEERVNATFAFFGEAAEVRDIEVSRPCGRRACRLPARTSSAASAPARKCSAAR